MTPTRPWLLEVATEDGVGFHTSRHATREEAAEPLERVRADWRSLGWGQDPQLPYISAKAIRSCITEPAPTPSVAGTARGAS